jgi:hypothetical protein
MPNIHQNVPLDRCDTFIGAAPRVFTAPLAHGMGGSSPLARISPLAESNLDTNHRSNLPVARANIQQAAQQQSWFLFKEDICPFQHDTCSP